MRKRLLAIVATLAMVMTMIPSVAFADVADTDVAKIGDTGYATLQGALDAAEDGDIVTLLATYDNWKMIQVGKNLDSVDETVTIDLNGFNINRTFGGIALDVVDGTVTIKGNGFISGSSEGISVAYDAALVLEKGVTVEGRDGHGVDNDGILTINGATVTGNNGGYGVALYEGTLTMNDGSVSGEYGIAAYTDTEVAVNGGTITGTVAGISGHGQYHGTKITITDGTIKSENGVGIYHPQNGELNISGGVITGATGINMKSGKLNITDGEIVGTGDAAEYEFVGGGFNVTGDALVIESCGYPGGAPTASIVGGIFTSEKADSVASYAGNGVTDVVTEFVKGGIYNVAPVDYIDANEYAILVYSAGEKEVVAKVDYEDFTTFEAVDENGVTYLGYDAEAIAEASGLDVADVERVAYEIYFIPIGPSGDLDDEENYIWGTVAVGNSVSDYMSKEDLMEILPEYAGYEFAGWWTIDEDGNFDKQLDIDAEVTSDTDYYAAWTKVGGDNTGNSAVTPVTPERPTPETTQTGDNSNMAVPMALAGLAVAAMAAVVMTRRKQGQK